MEIYLRWGDSNVEIKAVWENKILNSIVIVQEPKQLIYNHGDKFNKEGMIVNAIFDDGRKLKIDSYKIINGESLNSNGQTFITILYDVDGIELTTTQNIVVNRVLYEIKIDVESTKLTYFQGENFSSDGMNVIAKYTDNTYTSITDYVIENGTNLLSSQTTVKLIYIENGISKDVEQPITVKPVLYLYSYGIENADYGNWGVGNTGGGTYGGGLTKNETYMTMRARFVSGSRFARYSTFPQNTVDLTNYNAIELTYTYSTNGSGVKVYLTVDNRRIYYGSGTEVKGARLASSSTPITVTIDVSDLTGEYFVGVASNSGEDDADTYTNIYELKIY